MIAAFAPKKYLVVYHWSAIPGSPENLVGVALFQARDRYVLHQVGLVEVLEAGPENDFQDFVFSMWDLSRTCDVVF